MYRYYIYIIYIYIHIYICGVSFPVCPNDFSPKSWQKKTFRLQLKKNSGSSHSWASEQTPFPWFHGSHSPRKHQTLKRTQHFSHLKISRYITPFKGGKDRIPSIPLIPLLGARNVSLRESIRSLYEEILEISLLQTDNLLMPKTHRRDIKQHHLSMNRGRNETRMALSLRRQEVFDLTWFGGRAKIRFIGEKIM